MAVKVKKKKVYNPYPLVVNAMRRVWFMSPQRKEALARAKAYRDYIKADGTKGKRKLFLGYTCEKCGGLFLKVDVHHINPIGNVFDMVFNEALLKMFCSADDLLVLCKQCHIEIHKEIKKSEKSA